MSGKMTRILTCVIFVVFLSSAEAIDCKKDCEHPDFSNPNYKPQDCAKFCKNSLSPKHHDSSVEDEVEDLQDQVHRLTSMIIAVLVLMVLVFLALILFIFKNTEIVKSILSWKSKTKKMALPIENKNGSVKETVITMNESTQKTPIRETSSMQPNSKLKVRVSTRQKSPSESTCPDDGEAVEVNGYDNLAMSRSTLGTHSPPSSPVSPAITEGYEASVFNTTTTTVQLDSPRSSFSHRHGHS